MIKENTAVVLVRPKGSEPRIALRLKSTDGVDATCDVPLLPTYQRFSGDVSVNDAAVRVLSYGQSNQSGGSYQDQNDRIAVELGPVTKDTEFQVQIPLEEQAETRLQPIVYRTSAPKTKLGQVTEASESNVS